MWFQTVKNGTNGIAKETRSPLYRLNRIQVNNIQSLNSGFIKIIIISLSVCLQKVIFTPKIQYFKYLSEKTSMVEEELCSHKVSAITLSIDSTDAKKTRRSLLS